MLELKRLVVNMKPADYDLIKKTAAQEDRSMSKYLVNCHRLFVRLGDVCHTCGQKLKAAVK